MENRGLVDDKRMLTENSVGVDEEKKSLKKKNKLLSHQKTLNKKTIEDMSNEFHKKTALLSQVPYSLKFWSSFDYGTRLAEN